MELQAIMNSPGLWIASSFTVIVVIAQSIMFFRAGIKEAKRLEMPKERYISGLRSAMITAIGPSFASVIVLLSLLSIVGAPTTWMRLSDIGAARTEIAMITLSSGLLGIDPASAEFGVKAFSYSIWGMALNNLGWIMVALLLTHRMTKAVETLNTKYDPAWIKLLLYGATVGLFSYLLNKQVLGKGLDFSKITAAIISALAMFFITKLFKKNQRLQELGLGIAMLIGMFVSNAIF